MHHLSVDLIQAVHRQVDFIVAVSNGDAAASLFPQIRSLFQLSGFRDGFNRVIGTAYSSVAHRNIVGQCSDAPGGLSDNAGCGSDAECQEMCNADSSCLGYIDMSAMGFGYMTKNYVSGCFENRVGFVLRVKPAAATTRRSARRSSTTEYLVSSTAVSNGDASSVSTSGLSSSVSSGLSSALPGIISSVSPISVITFTAEPTTAVPTTFAPTNSPSKSPSYSPTKAPTFEPTKTGATKHPTSSPSSRPTTMAPTLNTDATLSHLSATYVQTGDSRSSDSELQFSQSESQDGFIPTWYSYGPVEADATRGGSLNLTAIPSFPGSAISVTQDGDGLFFGKTEEPWIILNFRAGSQSTLKVGVVNADSGVSIDYEVVVTRPLSSCTSTQLGQWYSAHHSQLHSQLVNAVIMSTDRCCREPWDLCTPSCGGASSQLKRIRRVAPGAESCAGIFIEEKTETCESKECNSKVEGPTPLEPVFVLLIMRAASAAEGSPVH